MQTLVKERLDEGNWVRGKTMDDEKFHGYIEWLDEDNGIAKIKVTACDNERAIGRTVSCLTASLTILTEDALIEEGHLYNFIDLALSTKDKTWFMELTSQLKETSHTTVL